MDITAIRRYLDALIVARGENYTSVSLMLGRNRTYLQQFIKRGVPRRLFEADRAALARHFGIAEHLLGGPADRIGRAFFAQSSAATAADDYLLIPQLSVEASAGDGSDPGPELPVAAIAFQTRWVRNFTNGGPQALSVIAVQGDSMRPTLADGDQIMVDTHDNVRLRDGIYVLRTDDLLLVKRLSINPATRRLSIRSDNKAYPSWENCDPSGVTIIGRVVWVGRQLR